QSRTDRMQGLKLVLAVTAMLVSFSATADAAMPRKFTIACDPGRFGHGRTEAAARSDVERSAERGEQYRDTYAFDLDARQTRMSWANGRRSLSHTITALTADTIEIYN